MPVLTEETTYSIGEAADVLEISIPTLRLYEQHGLIIPMRRKSGHRRYAVGELDRVRRIRNIVHSRRFSIDSLRDFFATTTHATRRDCMLEDGEHLPCWMHPGRSAEEQSSRCRLCDLYTSTIDQMERG